ncbi:hypothetical protein ACUH9Y_08960 [Dermabacteraceae bacterium P13115]
MLEFENHMSKARFETYVRMGGDPSAQRQLYLWNVDLAGEVGKVVGHVEVFVREAMDRQLKAWNKKQPEIDGKGCDAQGNKIPKGDPRRRPSGGTDTWVRNPGKKLYPLINSKKGSEYKSASDRARASFRSGFSGTRHQWKSPNHDDVVAHLTLGFWKRLIFDPAAEGAPNGQNKKDLWNEALKHAFPGLMNNPEKVLEYLSYIHTVRNRVSHQENLILLDVDRFEAATSGILSAIDPGLGSWLAEQSKVKECWSKKPPVPNKL